MTVFLLMSRMMYPGILFCLPAVFSENDVKVDVTINENIFYLSDPLHLHNTEKKAKSVNHRETEGEHVPQSYKL